MGLSFQYMIDIQSGTETGNAQCYVSSINFGAVTHNFAEYLENPIRGDIVRKYVYQGNLSEPLEVSITGGSESLVWLKWFASLRSGKGNATRHVSIHMYETSKSLPQTPLGDLWLTFDLENAFPVSWQLKQISSDGNDSLIGIDVKLRFEMMRITSPDRSINLDLNG